MADLTGGTQLAFFLLGGGELSQALDLFELDKLAAEDKVTYAMMLLASADKSEDKQRKAEDMLLQVLEEDRPLDLHLEAIGILAAMGNHAEVQAQVKLKMAEADDFRRAVLKCLAGAGETGKGELLSSAGDSRYKKTTAYYFLGMKQLSDDREKALGYFVDSERLFDASGHYWRSRELRRWLESVLKVPHTSRD